MGDVVRLNEFIQTQGLHNEFLELAQNIDMTSKKFISLINETKQVNQSLQNQKVSQSNASKAIKQTNTNLTKLTNLEKERVKITNQVNQTLAKSVVTGEKQNKTLQKGKVAIQQRNQVLRNQAKIERLNTEEGRKLNQTLIAQRKELTRLGGRGKGLIQSLKGMAMGFLGVTALIYGTFRAIKSAVKIFSDFEQQMDKVQAITGATAPEMKALSDNAKELGGTTTQTATQVGELQEEFAKLGFTTKDILNATKATIALSEAAGSDLAQSAVVAASTLRGFGLEATETQRVVDVMAKSFSSSSLDMEKFSVAMGSVAPAAKASGVNIETTTALLGTLTDAGIDASTAGTALRNIFLENAKSGRTFDESLALINKSSNKNATAMDLFGKRGAVAGLVLADNTKKTAELAEKLDNAAGSAQKMADIMRDNLAGDVKILKSAWEGLILSMEDGGGVLNKFARGFIQKLTEMLIAITAFRDKFINAFNDLIRTSGFFRAVIVGLKEVFTNVFKVIIDTTLLTIEPIILLGNALKDIVEGNFKNLGKTFKNGFFDIKTRAVDLFDVFKKGGQNIAAAFRGDDIEKYLLGVDTATETVEGFTQGVLGATTAIEEETEEIEKNTEAKEENIEKTIDLGRVAIEEQNKITEAAILAAKKELLEFQGTNEEKIEAYDRLAERILEIQMNSLQMLLDNENLTAEQRAEIEAQLVDYQIKQDEKRTEKTIENEEKIREEKRRTRDEIIALTQTAFNFISDINSQQLENLEAQKEYELSLVGDNETKKAAIERKYDQKAREIKRRQAIADKAQGIFNAAINTATAITAALTIPVVGIALAALVGVLGAIQIAIIAAKPIPKFAKGTPGLKEDMFAEIGEAGPEIINMPDRAPILVKKKTTAFLPKATEIIPNYETDKILADKGGISEQQFNKLIKATEKKPLIINNSTLVTEKGFEYQTRKGNNHIKWLNKYIGR